MESFYMSLNVVVPLFLIMCLGYFLRYKNMFDDQLIIKLNKIIFQCLCPILIFINLYETDIKSVFNIRLVLFSVITLSLFLLFLIFIVPLFEKDNKRKGVAAQGIFRSNFLLFGIPITTSIFGQTGASNIAVLIASTVIIFNVGSVICLEVFNHEKINYKKIFKGIIKNPLIIGIFVGLFFVLFQIKLPKSVVKSMKDISGIATPLALLTLGAFFNFKNARKNIKPLFWISFSKLVIMPAIFLSLSVLFGFKGTDLGSLLAMYASPTAVSSFVMAQNSGGDGELAGQIVAVSSIFSVFSIFIFIFLLKPLLMS